MNLHSVRPVFSVLPVQTHYKFTALSIACEWHLRL